MRLYVTMFQGLGWRATPTSVLCLGGDGECSFQYTPASNYFINSSSNHEIEQSYNWKPEMVSNLVLQYWKIQKQKWKHFECNNPVFDDFNYSFQPAPHVEIPRTRTQ